MIKIEYTPSSPEKPGSFTVEGDGNHLHIAIIVRYLAHFMQEDSDNVDLMMFAIVVSDYFDRFIGTIDYNQINHTIQSTRVDPKDPDLFEEGTPR